MPDPCFHLLTTMEQMQTIIPQWIALHERDTNATPFQRPEWLLPWWRQFGTDELCTIAVFQGGALIALLPLYIYTESQAQERQLMLLGVGTSDYLDGVYSPDCTAICLVTALQWLAQQCTWNSFSLVQMRAGSPLLEAAQQLDGDHFTTDHTSVLPAVTIAELPTKIRRNAMYYRNAAQRGGALQLSTATESDYVGRFDDLVRMHTARWQGRGEQGVLADPRVLAWHLEALPLLARAGLLRLYTLTLACGAAGASESIGAMYALADLVGRPNRVAYFYLPGFSIAHGDLRPGTLLMALAIEHAAAEGIRTIDLLRGDEAYKQHWHAAPVSTFGCNLPFAALFGSSPAELEAVA